MKRMIASAALLLSAVSAQAQPKLETAVLAGGCFWGMEAVFEHVKGVREVVSGYAGGSAKDANYSAVSTERTRHAEVVRITYDPKQISFAELLRIYVTVAHDPTQLNRQGPDVGPSYRSAIFPQSPAQRRIAKLFLDKLGRANAFPSRIVTRIEGGQFHAAEAHHQDFARKNPRHPYIVAHDLPKLEQLRRRYPQYWRA